MQEILDVSAGQNFENDSTFLLKMDEVAHVPGMRYKDVDPAHERHLIALFQTHNDDKSHLGESAIATLLNLHKGLIKKIARDEFAKASRTNLNFDHILLAGVNGFVSAVDSWNPKKSNNGRLATFAHSHIRAGAQYEIALQRGITKWELESLARLRYAVSTLKRKNPDHEPDDGEIANELRWKATTVVALRNKVERSVRLILVDENKKNENMSIEKEPLFGYGGPHSVEDDIVAREYANEVHEQLELLPPELANILNLEYGVGRHGPHSIAQMARKLNIPDYKVKRLRKIALFKLSSALK